MRRRVLGACGLLLAGAAVPAAAESRLDPPELARYVRWGPLRARPTLELSDAGYDDNILAGARDEVADYTATLSQTLDGLLLFGSRGFLTFRERLEFTGYKDNSDQNYVNQRGEGRLTAPFGRFGVFSDFKLDRVEERPVDLEDIRPRRDETGLGLGIIVRAGGRTEIELRQSGTRFRYSDPDFDQNGQSIGERLDRDVTRSSLEADYHLVGRTRLTLDASFGDIEFTDLDLGGREKDSAAWSLLPGIDFGERGTLSGTARAGWARINADDPLIADFSGFVGKAELVYRPLRRGRLNLEWRREPAFSIYEDAIYLLNRSVKLGGVYYLVWPVGIESSIRRGKVDFPSGGSERVDRNLEYEIGLRLRVAENDAGRRVEYSIKYRRYEVDSNDDSLDRTRNSVGFNAVLGY
jgi:hypothetical protein